MEKLKKRNIMLLGPQRSGTTLVCHLLNKLANVVALHEPLVPNTFLNSTPNEILNKIDFFCEEQRVSLLNYGKAISKSQQHKVPDNHMGEIDKQTGKRIDLSDGNTLLIDKSLSSNFTLLIKHCAFFVGILDTLVSSYECFAVIRNPLSTLLSWNTLNFKVSKGRAPAAERFDPFLEEMVLSEENIYKRQIILLNWYYEKIYRLIPKENIIFYENIISTGGRNLALIDSRASQLSETLSTKNNNPLYDKKLKPILAEMLLDQVTGGYLRFYQKKSILDL